MKISYSDFQLLTQYMERHAKGQTMTLHFQQNSHLEIKISNSSQEPVVITIYPEQDNNATSMAKISVTRRLGDEI